MYHADMRAFARHQLNQLEVLVEAQRFLAELRIDAYRAKSLRTPDDSRYIIESEPKLRALGQMSVELDDLLIKVVQEQHAVMRYQDQPSLDTSRFLLRQLNLP